MRLPKRVGTCIDPSRTRDRRRCCRRRRRSYPRRSYPGRRSHHCRRHRGRRLKRRPRSSWCRRRGRSGCCRHESCWTLLRACPRAWEHPKPCKRRPTELARCGARKRPFDAGAKGSCKLAAARPQAAIHRACRTTRDTNVASGTGWRRGAHTSIPRCSTDARAVAGQPWVVPRTSTSTPTHFRHKKIRGAPRPAPR
jgi:hypothetical protein